ncbi:MAG: NTP transferase domain-containing protein [Clostridia bacterium]|nr:NTP transferase domain-containing protein [Clostridia bacterium]
MDIVGVILAAGKSKRMNFCKNKIFMPLCGKPIISHIVENLKNIGITNITIVCSAQDYKNLHAMHPACNICVQEVANGTGGAIMACAKTIKNFSRTLIINGDGPVLCSQFLQQFLLKNNADLTILTNTIDVHSTNGRILKKDKKVVSIVEYKDANKQQKQITKGNAGVYIFDTKKLLDNLTKLTPNNAQNELYITDMVNIFSKQKLNIQTCDMPNENNYLSVNTMQELNLQNIKMQKDIIVYHSKNGVYFVQPNNVYIDCDVQIGFGTIVFGGAQLLGKTKIGQMCKIGANSVLKDCIIPNNTTIAHGSVKY